ncbi:MAG: hypothetical protein JKY12_01630 [Sneathiella sp.]|nr:hypothetical protein [Sneathiella sp.]
MKLYKSSTFNVIFLIPIAMAATGDGCSTTPEGIAVAPKEITTLFSNNTIKVVDNNIFAFTRKDGSMVGENIVSGGTVGKWWLNEDGVLCADWQDDKEDARCDKLILSGDKTYEWFGTKLQILKGNTQNL